LLQYEIKVTIKGKINFTYYIIANLSYWKIEDEVLWNMKVSVDLEFYCFPLGNNKFFFYAGNDSTGKNYSLLTHYCKTHKCRWICFWKTKVSYCVFFVHTIKKKIKEKI